jgi:hypothetical protein
MKTLLLGFLIGLALAALVFGGEPRHRGHSKHSKNYILRRQQTYQVQGVPTSRLIIGRREIDVYRNGLMFEKDNVVGVTKR